MYVSYQTAKTVHRSKPCNINRLSIWTGPPGLHQDFWTGQLQYLFMGSDERLICVSGICQSEFCYLPPHEYLVSCDLPRILFNYPTRYRDLDESKGTMSQLKKQQEPGPCTRTFADLSLCSRMEQQYQQLMREYEQAAVGVLRSCGQNQRVSDVCVRVCTPLQVFRIKN